MTQNIEETQITTGTADSTDTTALVEESASQQESAMLSTDQADAGTGSTAEAMDAESELSTSTQGWQRPLTPEQHQQKLIRDRARRANKSKNGAAAAQAAADATPLTQAQNDIPFQQKLSEMLQKQTKARILSMAESQRRQARGK